MKNKVNRTLAVKKNALKSLFIVMGCLVASSVWAETTLFSADFSTWTAKTYSAATFENGVYFNPKNNKTILIDNTGVNFNGQNASGKSHTIGIPVTGVNGSVTITITHDYAASASYKFKMGYTSGSDYASANPTISDAFVKKTTETVSNLTGTDFVFWFGEAGTGYKSIKSITITTPDGGTQVAVTGVSLNKTTTSIEVGASETLTATITPSNATNQKVSWTSDNTSVATVNNGVVTGVGTGTANITVTTEDGSKTATCAVTVNTPSSDPIAVTGVSLDKELIYIKVGATETLTATITPSNATNKNVTWSSSNNNVATVSNGIVTGVAAGMTSIIVTTVDGKKNASCFVTVTEATPVPPTDLTLHVPEKYEAKASAEGYNTPLTVVGGREYEVYYMTRDANSEFCIATTNADKTTGITTLGASEYSCTANDGWFDFSGIGWSSSTDDMGDEFGTMARRLDMDNTCEFSMHIKGFDQFALVAKDKKLDTSSGQTKPENNRYLEVYIDNILQPLQFNSNPSIRRYSITTQEHVVRVIHYGSEKSSMYAFSLRVAQEPKTKRLKGNDSTQVVLQTMALRPVTYVTKYNNVPGAETKLEWKGTPATGVELKKREGSLADTLTLSGTVTCPVGIYNYAVVSYLNGVETSRAEGKFTVKSDIMTLSSSADAKVYTGEVMDNIEFQYYALSANDVKFSWENNQAPAGISGKATTPGKFVISGTPTATGTYKYSITVTDAETTISGTITVEELNYGNDPVLYLFKNDNAPDKDGVYKYLTTNGKNLIKRKTKEDGLRPADQYAKYKWVLISEDVDADNKEVLALARGEGGLPVLNMKSFTYTEGRLNWGEPDNGSLSSNGRYITVQRDDHPIFKAMNKKRGDQIMVLDTVIRKGLMPINVNYSGTLCLATALTRDKEDYYGDGPEQTILHEVPASMNFGQKYICLPIGAEGSNRLTNDGKKLIDECIKYILGNEATITVPQIAITKFKIGQYEAKNIDDGNHLIEINVELQDSDAMKAATPEITLASPLTFYTADKQYVNADGTVDFSNWHYGVRYVVSDYINSWYYDVIINLYDPHEGIENIEVGTWVNIYDIYGRKVATTNEDLRTMTLPHGMYIVVTEDGQTIKIMK